MRISRTLVATVAVAAFAASGCGKTAPSKPGATSTSPSSATSSPAQSTSASASASAAVAQPTGEYGALLIPATDIGAPIPFTAGAPTANPNGQEGVAVTYSTADHDHEIIDTIEVFGDPSAAADALTAAKSAQAKRMKAPRTEPNVVGTGGTTVSGTLTDGSKGVTTLLFTVGKAFVTMEFLGAAEFLPPPDFVTSVGNKQADAVKKGLGN